MPATNLAKVKTWVQAMAVGWALFPPTAVDVPIIAGVFLWLAVALTLVTGYQYFSRPRAATAMGSNLGVASMRCEVVAIGTELLLGQVVDTNSSWIGEQLALAGIDCHHHVRVGDNLTGSRSSSGRRSSAVARCRVRGLGPPGTTSRDVIAKVMGVPLHRGAEVEARIQDMFGRGAGTCPRTTCRPASPRAPPSWPNNPGPHPGLVCPVGDLAAGAAEPRER